MPGFDSRIRQGVYQLFRYGVTTVSLPEYLNALLAAEEWGTPPWEVLPGYASRNWWLAQRNSLIAERNRAHKDKNG